MAETPESTEQKSSASFASGGGGSNTLTMILAVVNTLVSAGMLVVLFLSFQKQKQTATVDDIAGQTQTAEGHEAKGEEGQKAEGEGEAAKTEAEKKPTDAFGKVVTLEQFTVNLSTPGSVSPRFVRVNISLEVPNEETEMELNAKIPQVRNAIIDLFNSKKPADLATVEGREFLKGEIKNALDSFLVNGKIKGVFFTSFALAG